MSVCDPKTAVSYGKRRIRKEQQPFENPNLALYVGNRGFPDSSDPETTMLFPSSWFQ